MHYFSTNPSSKHANYEPLPFNDTSGAVTIAVLAALSQEVQLDSFLAEGEEVQTDVDDHDDNCSVSTADSEHSAESSVALSVYSDASIQSELDCLEDSEDALRKELNNFNQNPIQSEIEDESDNEDDACCRRLFPTDSKCSINQDAQVPPQLRRLSTVSTGTSVNSLSVSDVDDRFEVPIVIDIKTECSKNREEEEVSTRIGLDYVADLAFGRHEYEIRPTLSPKGNQMHLRSIQGGVSVMLATAVAIGNLFGTGSLLSLLMVPLLSVLVMWTEINLPHRVEETSIALCILVLQMICQSVVQQ